MNIYRTGPASPAQVPPKVGSALPSSIASTFHTLVLQPTTLCNLDCSYCYLPDRHARRAMPVGIACRVAESIAEQAAAHPVEVVWHAGEPLATPIGHFRALLTAFEAQQAAGRVRHGVQTNATLIDHGWCEIFAEYGFRVGISVDGPAAYNRNRRDWAGRESFERAMRGVEVLREAGIEFSAICVVSAETVHAADQFPAMLARAGHVRYTVEFAEGLTACRLGCDYFDFCRGAQAGNRYFEHGTFASTETAFCRNTRQALVQAAVDHIEEGR